MKIKKGNQSAVQFHELSWRRGIMYYDKVISGLKLLALATLLLGGAMAQAEDEWIDCFEPHTLKEMGYRLMSPAHFEPDTLYPVIVSLHGGGGKGTDNLKQLRGWNRLFTEEQRRTDYPCYVLAPQTDRLWDGEHLTLIKEIIAGLPSVDRNRIYILGHSMGGHGSFILLQLDTGYFAAAAPSAGTGLESTEPFIDAALLKDVPI